MPLPRREPRLRRPPPSWRTPLLAGAGTCACFAAGCAAFHVQAGATSLQSWPLSSARAQATARHATRAPPDAKTEVYSYESLEPLDLPMAPADGQGQDSWSGHMDGFDWQLERARRALAGPGFSPFRMSFWAPEAGLSHGDGSDDGDEDRGAASSSGGGAKGSSSGGGGAALGVVTPWDTAYILLMNVAQKLGWPSVDGAPVAKIGGYKGSFFNFLAKVASGRLEDLAGGPLFLMLEKYFRENGPVYKLAFGPRSFIIVSDPVMAKHVLKANVGAYDKGVLASILEPIMGKGLIPADPATWKVRRRAIVPGFHKRWLNRMMRLFAECNDGLLTQVGIAADMGAVIDMEEKFCSVSLDIIGKAVFNFHFGSVTVESPVIKAVYRVLREAEHRSSSFIPYWKLPAVEKWLPSQAEFAADMRLLNDVLDELIRLAMATQQQASVEQLESRDLEEAEDPSLLRFLVDMRGEDTTSKQLRDDLMTMLIAGHETTAAVLTWTLFNLAQNPDMMRRVQADVDAVLGPERLPTYDDLPQLRLARLSLVEALRLYPEPPVLIRRALQEDLLPAGGAAAPVRLLRGTDVFVSTWNLHRSPHLWDRPEVYDPERFLRPFKNPAVKGWAGYSPDLMSGLYPNEIASDFAFLPFGGGTRKCVGDQFAMMEAVVTLCMLVRDFDFELAKSPEEVGMVTGATIHTATGLSMRAFRRQKPPLQEGGAAEAAAAEAAAAAAEARGHVVMNGAAVTAVNGAAATAVSGAAQHHDYHVGVNGAAHHVSGNGEASLRASAVTGGGCPMHLDDAPAAPAAVGAAAGEATCPTRLSAGGAGCGA
ncbi:unnamed protein product [Phaeothamnion confervicola]